MPSQKELERRKSLGLCHSCGARPKFDKYVKCKHCWERDRARKDTLKRYHKLKDAGLCASCGITSPRQGKVLCSECAKKQRTYQNYELNRQKEKDRRERIKRQAMEHYGTKCACCGESNIAFLTIDHVNNDGAKQRKETGIPGGTATYKWIIDNGYPANLQILCANCNLAKHWNGGICPHKAKRNKES